MTRTDISSSSGFPVGQHYKSTMSVHADRSPTISVIVCTDHSGKKLPRQVGVGSVATSGSLGGVMIITLAKNAREMVSIPALGTRTFL